MKQQVTDIKIQEELDIIKELGITFREKEDIEDKQPLTNEFGLDKALMDPKNNALIPD